MVPLLHEPRHAHGARGLRDAPPRLPKQLDGRAHLLVGHCDEFVDEVTAEGKGVRAGRAHRRAVAEHVDVVQRHRLARGDRRLHARLVHALDPDNANVRVVGLEPAGHRRRHATAADLDVGHVVRPLPRHDDTVRQRALAAHGAQVVVGVDVGAAGLLGELLGFHTGHVVGVADQDNLDLVAAVAPHGGLLHPWRGQGHVDACVGAEFPRRDGHALRMVPRRRRHHAAGLLLFGQECHAVVGAAPFVGVDGGAVLALEEDLGGDRNVEHLERCRFGHGIDPLARHENLVEQFLPHATHGPGPPGGPQCVRRLCRRHRG